VFGIEFWLLAALIEDQADWSQTDPTGTQNRSESFDVDHRLGEGLRGFLGQVVTDAALLPAYEFHLKFARARNAIRHSAGANAVIVLPSQRTGKGSLK
jgi:hypothetical protein